MFGQETAEIYIPDGETIELAFGRTTHLGIGAHHDDLEIMAIGGILDCYQQEDKWFSGVVVTNGSGSPRGEGYIEYTDEEMVSTRRLEQKKAAFIGEYGSQVLLDYPSSAVKDDQNSGVKQDLTKILKKTRPEFVYTHNLADKHDTHVAVAMRVIQAIRSLEKHDRPQFLYGCEVWRDLDWMIDQDKVVFDLSSQENLQAALLSVFDSQVSGGKRYDLATMGRRKAHSTYFQSHAVDQLGGVSFAMNLSPLIVDDNLSVSDYVERHIDRFRQSVLENINKRYPKWA